MMMLSNPFLLVLGGGFFFLDFAWLRDRGLSDSAAVLWVQWLIWVYLAFITRFLADRKGQYFLLGNLEGGKNDSAVDVWNWKVYSHSVAFFLAGVAAVKTDYFWCLPIVTLITFGYQWRGKTLRHILWQADWLEKGEELSKDPIPHTQEKNMTMGDTFLFVFGALLSITILLLSIANGYTSINLAMSILFIASQSYINLILPQVASTTSGGNTDGPHCIDMSLVHTICLQVSILFSISLVIVRPGLAGLNIYAFIAPIFGAGQTLCFFSLLLQDYTVPASTFQTIAIGLLQATIMDQSTVTPEIALLGMIAVSQTIATIPNNGKSSGWLIVFVLVPITVLIRHHLPLFGQQDSNGLLYRQHPIETLFARAKIEAEQMEARQSKNLPAAVEEYKRRYKRSPPPHFDKWFQMAQDAGMVLVDEFDTIMQTIEPFWGEDPGILRARVQSAIDSTKTAPIGHGIIGFRIKDQRIFWPHLEHISSRYPVEIEHWLGPNELAVLPDLTFGINALDEPRVVIRRDILDRAMAKKFSSTKPRPESDLDDFQPQLSVKDSTVAFMDIGAQNNWQATTISCSDDDPAVAFSAFGSPMDLGFVQNVTAAFDICSHPSFRQMHGMFISPASMRLTHNLVPIFSQSKPSSFNDIVYPSPHYALEMYAPPAPFDVQNLAWDEKRPQLYWAGSSTGGQTTNETWSNMQRQRLALHTSKEYIEQNEVILLGEDVNGRQWVPYQYKDPPQNTTQPAMEDIEPEPIDIQRDPFGKKLKSLHPESNSADSKSKATRPKSTDSKLNPNRNKPHLSQNQPNSTHSQSNSTVGQANSTLSQFNSTLNPINSTLSPMNTTHDQLNLTEVQLNSTQSQFGWTGTTSLAKLFNVSISGVVQCDLLSCADQAEAFHLSELLVKPGPNEYQNFKYVLDMDGNGYSGRYYRLLKSSTAVIKQTILKEWHDDWLIPWVHFIPLSLEGLEIYEIMRFLITDERGDKIGQEIGDRGRQWAERVLRKRDLELVMVRILMEYGRVMSDDRDEMKFSW